MFFSVKVPLRIAGKDYIPCVCYPLPRFLEYTVKELKKEGKVEIYDKMVFFQNGKLIEKAEPKPVITEVKSKKEKKAKTAPVVNTEDLAKKAEIVPIEEVPDDEVEGF